MSLFFCCLFFYHYHLFSFSLAPINYFMLANIFLHVVNFRMLLFYFFFSLSFCSFLCCEFYLYQTLHWLTKRLAQILFFFWFYDYADERCEWYNIRMGYLKHNIYTFIYFGKWLSIYVLAAHCLTLVHIL